MTFRVQVLVVSSMYKHLYMIAWECYNHTQPLHAYTQKKAFEDMYYSTTMSIVLCLSYALGITMQQPSIVHNHMRKRLNVCARVIEHSQLVPMV